MIPDAFEYVAPSSVAEALQLLADRGDDAKVLAGGHSLIPLMKLRLARPAVLIDISRIRELKGISRDGTGLRIGAATTHASCIAPGNRGERPSPGSVHPPAGDSASCRGTAAAPRDRGSPS